MAREKRMDGRGHGKDEIQREELTQAPHLRDAELAPDPAPRVPLDCLDRGRGGAAPPFAVAPAAFVPAGGTGARSVAPAPPGGSRGEARWSRPGGSLGEAWWFASLARPPPVPGAAPFLKS